MIPSMNRDTLTSFHYYMLLPFFFFFCLVAGVRSTTLNRSNQNGHHCLVASHKLKWVVFMQRNKNRFLSAKSSVGGFQFVSVEVEIVWGLTVISL